MRRGWGGLALATLGCGHVIHPAAVSDGVILDVLPGATLVHHAPKTDSGTSALTEFEPFRSVQPVAQLNLGYGWRFSRHCGLQLLASGGIGAAPTLVPYVQFLGDPLDLGIGLTASLNGRSGGSVNGYVPGSYLLAGRAFGPTGALRVDLGFRWLRIHDGVDWQQGLGPSGLVALRRGRFAIGAWADYMHLTGVVRRSMCADICQREDLADGAIGFGAFLRVLGFGRGAR